MNLPSLSFLVPCYNKSVRLQLCLEAIRHQIYPNYQIVVSDDGSDSNENAQLAKDYGAEYVRKERTFIDGKGAKNIPEVLNQGMALCSGDVVQTLQQDHIIAPDFGLWLARAIDSRMILFGLTDHTDRLFTRADLDAMLRTAHLPDGEVRYIKYCHEGRATLVEIYDWRECDGLDMACAREKIVAFDTRFKGQDHAWLDWMLTQQMRGLRLVINPLMRLWHQDEPPAENREEWEAQLKVSYRQMQEKWQAASPDVWTALVRQVEFRELRDERQKEYP